MNLPKFEIFTLSDLVGRTIKICAFGDDEAEVTVAYDIDDGCMFVLGFKIKEHKELG